MTREGKALMERVWNLFDKFQMTPSEIDREIGRPNGTAKILLRERWGRMR